MTMTDKDSKENSEITLNKLYSIATRDDPEGLVKLYHENPVDVRNLAVSFCAMGKAKKCLISLVSGKIFQPPFAPKGCFTSIHLVAWFFPDPDVIDIIMLNHGAIKDLNVKLPMADGLFSIPRTPLELVLAPLSSESLQTPYAWSPGDSILKLIILVCQWDTKPRLDAARMFAQHTDSVNDIAWTFLETGKLISLAALLLVARKKVLVPFETGMTVQQHLESLIDSSSSGVDLKYEQAEYKSMLMDACKLFDAFEKVGDSLDLYCQSMIKQVSPRTVLADVSGILNKAGFALQFEDLDLRDCFRGSDELWTLNLLKLSDNLRSDNRHLQATRSRIAVPKIPSNHWDPLIGRVKSGEVLKLASSASRPRLLSTAACKIDQTCAVSSGLLKFLAHVAMKLKKGIRVV